MSVTEDPIPFLFLLQQQQQTVERSHQTIHSSLIAHRLNVWSSGRSIDYKERKGILSVHALESDPSHQSLRIGEKFVKTRAMSTTRTPDAEATVEAMERALRERERAESREKAKLEETYAKIEETEREVRNKEREVRNARMKQRQLLQQIALAKENLARATADVDASYEAERRWMGMMTEISDLEQEARERALEEMRAEIEDEETTLEHVRLCAESDELAAEIERLSARFENGPWTATDLSDVPDELMRVVRAIVAREMGEDEKAEDAEDADDVRGGGAKRTREMK